MQNPFIYGVGGVLSADVAVPDHDRELDFYSRILTTGDEPLWRDDLTNNFGIPIIGLGVHTPEYNSLPLQWMPHFQVADVAASVTHAVDMGGNKLMQSEVNEWAVLADPDGAAFGVIPVVDSDSNATQQNQSKTFGRISWLSLAVPNALSSRDFYEKVVGLSGKSIAKIDTEEPIEKFAMQIDDEKWAAEIRQVCNEPKDIPSVWLIHLPVGDLGESLRRVAEGGGEVIEEFIDAKYAIVRDPVGVFLALQAG